VACFGSGLDACEHLQVPILLNPLLDHENASVGPAIVCLTGFRKPVRSAAHDRDYQAAREAREEFQQTRRVAR
jgi:hypothetical protein